MCEVIESTRHVIDENGLACWVIGDVKIGNTVHNLAKDVWHEVEKTGHWEIHQTLENENGIIVDEIAPSKKVTRIWNSGGHEIWNIHQDKDEEECIAHVATQADADQLVKELGIAALFHSKWYIWTSDSFGPHFDDKTYWLKSI